MSFAYVARQPIYTRARTVHAYELLYRAGDLDRADVVDGDQATATVLVNALAEIGLTNLVGDRPAYVNLTEGFLDPSLLALLPPERIVFEILEDIEVTDDVVRAVATVSAQGYRVALDDFEYTPAHDPLLRLADVVKFDVRALGLERLAEQVALVRPFDVELLAEKVETAEEFTTCLELGFHYFQGYYFGRPALVRQQTIPTNKLAMLRLLGQLQQPDIGMGELAAIIGQDVSLSYKILRFLNSAYVPLSRPIESVHQGVVLMGLTTVQRWAMLLVVAGSGDKPTELMVTAMVRGRFCEQLARIGHGAEPEAAFTVGLFSVLDALLDAPMDEVLGELTLGDEIEAALLHHEGPLGHLLAGVQSFESGDWAAVDALGLAPRVLQDKYVEALQWASDALARVAG